MRALDLAYIHPHTAIPDIAIAISLHDVQVTLHTGGRQICHRRHGSNNLHAGTILSGRALRTDWARYTLGSTGAFRASRTSDTLLPLRASSTSRAGGANRAWSSLWAGGASYALCSLRPGISLWPGRPWRALRTLGALDLTHVYPHATVPNIAIAIGLYDVEITRIGAGG